MKISQNYYHRELYSNTNSRVQYLEHITHVLLSEIMFKFKPQKISVTLSHTVRPS
jgi:hypothetical protein